MSSRAFCSHELGGESISCPLTVLHLYCRCPVTDKAEGTFHRCISIHDHALPSRLPFWFTHQQVERMLWRKTLPLRAPREKLLRMSSQFSFRETPIEEIRKHLIKFTGGSVELHKRDDGLAVVLLSQEEKKNAMTGKMMVDLSDAVEELKRWEAGKGFILKGKAGNFCSGGDLDFVEQVATPEEGFLMSTYMQDVLDRLQHLPLISVALIEGIGALGGGMELSTACDFILMSESCNGMGFVHARMGLVPAWGGANRLVERVGYTKALDLVSSSGILSPRECLRIGLVNEVVPSGEDAEQYAISWLQKRTRFDASLVRGMKNVLSTARDFPREFERERRLFAPFWGGPAHKEALRRKAKLKPDC